MSREVIEDADSYVIEITNPRDRQVISVSSVQWGIKIKSIVSDRTYTVIVDYASVNDLIEALKEIQKR